MGKTNIVERARSDIARILDRYRLTLPEIMGALPYDKDIDDKIWESIRDDYEKVQEDMLKKRYPRLWSKAKRN